MLVGADEEDIGVLVKDVVGSIAMVHVKIEYHDLQMNETKVNMLQAAPPSHRSAELTIDPCLQYDSHKRVRFALG